MKLTKSELEIMNTLWSAGRPLSRSEIISLSKDRSWNDSSIHIFLNSMLKKGAIVEAGFVKRVKTYGRLYAANISGEEYYAKTIFAGDDSSKLPMFFSALVQSKDITPELIEEMESLLAQKKRELEGE